jgi:hypothetical protein
MIKHLNIVTIALVGLGVLVLGCMAYALIVSKGRTVFPIRIKVERSYVAVPEGEVWVAALEQQLSSEQFEQVVKTNYEGRDFALGLFAYNDMTNHVRVLVKHGADMSDEALEALRFSGLSNTASLIEWVVKDLNHSSSNRAVQGAEKGR